MTETNTQPLEPNLNAEEGRRTALISYRFGVESNTPKASRRGSFMSFNDLPDLEALARDQGVSPVTDFESLLGDFWPEDESVEDFQAARERWRREAHNRDM